MVERGDLTRANRRLLIKLLLVAVGMFGFGYALVPLYTVFCEVTGLNGKTGQRDAKAAQAAEVDTSRWVTVEFTGTVMGGLPWEFKPMKRKLRVHPGEPATVTYVARNTATEAIVGQAVPSVSPFRAASHFRKMECFCFSRQELKSGEVKEMSVRFIVDAELPREVKTVTLSYAFFNADRESAKKYRSGKPAVHETIARGG